MSRQDKATTERHAKLLRGLVKQPDNKVCGDCKRNDPRWASWNLGIFLCIRCSGIHRGMGTHISKVKSIDLDTWTPEQMQSIQRWGNKRANLYWEALLRAGHVPPDHKMESFIRSKYESRRWALDGPPPDDPSILEDEPPISGQPRTLQQPSGPMHDSSEASVKKPPSTQQPHRTLLSMSISDQDQPVSHVLQHESTPSRVPAQTHQPRISSSNNDLFDLDFRAPSTMPATQSSTTTSDVKKDILSLFSATANFPISTAATQPPAWETSGTFQIQQAASSSSAGIGQWGVHSGWPPQTTFVNENNLWGGLPLPQSQAAAQHPNPSNVWASREQIPTVPLNEPSKKQDDVFGDLWGGHQRTT